MTKIINKTVLMLQIIMLLFASCTQKSVGQESANIYFKKKGECDSCRNCIHIPKSIEPNPACAELISAYFFSALMDEEICSREFSDSDKRELFTKRSIVDAISEVYLHGMEMRESHGPTYFSDHKIELLFHIDNNDVLHKIADTLLLHNEADGLMVLWNSLDLTKLNYFDEYYEQILSTGNIYKVAELTVSMHLNGYREREQKLLARAKELSNDSEETYTALQELLAQPSFDYMEYMSKIYYGQ